jgi:hypothetical protein
MGKTLCVTSANAQIGTPGTPWGAAERAEWKARQRWQRSYQNVVNRIDELRCTFDVATYGTLPQSGDAHQLFEIRTRQWSEDRPLVVVTGGVHGYETSGVHGALDFLQQHGTDFPEIDLLVAPCVSPWAYEHVQRWNADAIDPNRSFQTETVVEECAALMRLIDPLSHRVLLHIDLHETTDTDETEFRPALAARDGVDYEPDLIPDGFYLCGDSAAPELDFQVAIIEAVSNVTHIAPADAEGKIIGTEVSANGVILIPMRQLGLGAGITNAPFRTLTEVYPDSPRATPSICNRAQVTAVCAAIEFALANRR